ncbi:hypothetical protein BDY19DRAFT_534895 [Irpex rosettiformis]|uniref:Uncharacterized protein n=1 Tax=Irpex rosettiformis TaxID=378272 RepID=A0ACB8TRC1_9APHY|nr:hypothetical protein BDY19DRAFT_534895 [Irpex rosettiformis]
MNPAEAAHGPALIGIFINIFLFGIMLTQCFFYFTTYKKDSLWIKAYVLFLLFLDTLNCVLDIAWIYGDIILHFGDLDVISIANWKLQTDPAMAIIGTCCQLFFAWRVAVLTRNMWITALIVITAIVSMLGGLGVAIAITFVKFYKDFGKFDQVGAVWLVSTAVCDVTIASTLTWYLRKHRTGFSHTDDVLNKIIRLTVQNGAITAVWAIIDLILFLTIFSTESNEGVSTAHQGARSAAVPEFVTLTSHSATTHPEVMITWTKDNSQDGYKGQVV